MIKKSFEEVINDYLKKINPKILSLNKIKNIEIKKIGSGESNLNYLVIINKKKFNFRINMDSRSPFKSKEEFNALKTVERLKIAPKAYLYESNKKYFGETFLIIEYLEGKTLHNKKISKYLIKKLAKVVGNLHKKNIKKIKNNLKDSNIETLKEIKNRIPYIKIHRKKYNLSKDFDRLLLKKYNSLYSSELTKLKSQVLGHGDICPQNVIINKGKLKIIDWEDLGLIDPALEILRLYDDFNFSKDNQELFLKEYLKIKKENNLKICIQSSWDLYLLEVFTWAVMHVFEISEGDMHKEFIKKQNIKEHIDYAKEIFKKCIDKGIFPKNTKFNIKKRQNA